MEFRGGSGKRTPDFDQSDPLPPNSIPRSHSDFPTIIYVHDFGQQPEAVTFKAALDRAAFGMEVGDRTRLGYWSSVLHSPGSRIASTSIDGFGLSLNSGEVTAERLKHRVQESLAGIVDSNSETEQRAYRWLQSFLSYSSHSQDSREIDSKRLAQVCEASDIPENVARRSLLQNKQSTRTSDQNFLWSASSDAVSYFFDPSIRTRIQNRIRQFLSVDGGRFWIFAHGFGAVVAYDLLQEMDEVREEEPASVEFLVTLGSLIPAVAQSDLGLLDVAFLDRFRNLLKPGPVIRWLDFCDAADFVGSGLESLPQAVPVLESLATAYPITEDTSSDSRNRVLHDGYHPHSFISYLNSPYLQELVSKETGPSFVNRISDFRVAKDLVARMSSSTDHKHQILIELNDRTIRALSGPSGTADGGPQTANTAKQQVLEELKTCASLDAQRPSDRARSVSEILQGMRIDGCLTRYVSADLTTWQIEWLARRVSFEVIHRIWSDSGKSGLMNVSVPRMHAFAAHNSFSARGQRIEWAVLDSGINPFHPHFGGDPTDVMWSPPATPEARRAARIVAYMDCSGIDAPRPMINIARDSAGCSDESGHGTHVAGILAGQGEDAKGNQYCGMAPQAQLHIFRVLRGREAAGRDSSIIKALNYIEQLNDQAGRLVIHGVNLSLGGYFNAEVAGCGHSPLCKELRRLWRQGVVVCVAAGNEGRVKVRMAGNRPGEDEIIPLISDLSVDDPANLEECIAVGSVHRDQPHLYGVSYFSSRGPTADGRSKPDVVAPGERIVSCNAFYGVRGGLYVPDSGTSFSCPHVSGAIAVFLSVRPEFIGRPDEVKRLLMEHATDLGRDRYHQGAGLPNVSLMLTKT